jgi:predicted phage terminase large subunit-like protein
MKGSIFREEWFTHYDVEPDWTRCTFWIGCDPAATRADVLLTGRKATTDYWTIVVGARMKGADGELGREIYVKDLWRERCTKQEYLEQLKRYNERYKPERVVIEAVAAQEYLAQDAEKFMPVERLERVKDKVSRAYWLQAFFENRQIVMPARPLQSRPELWDALREELLLFPEGEHDDLFDGLQIMAEGAMKKRPSFGVMWLGPVEPEPYDPTPWARGGSRQEWGRGWGRW